MMAYFSHFSLLSNENQIWYGFGGFAEYRSTAFPEPFCGWNL